MIDNTNLGEDSNHNTDEVINKGTIKNIIIVAISNFFKILSGVLVGLIVPKIMGDTNYGYYKTYSLYLGYVGIFHFGFCDGIYLLYAGKNYGEIDKHKFRLFSKFMLLFQCIISLVIILISLPCYKSSMGFTFIFVGISLFGTNITTYYQMISQITNRFKELAIRNVILSILQSFCIIIFSALWYFNIINELSYKIFVICWSIILIIMSLWYIFSYRDITFGESDKVFVNKKNIFKIMKIGFPLMIANLTSILIMNFDKQFANILYMISKISIEDFGIYSFAYTLLGLITTVISAISTVIYPIIKVSSEEKLRANYEFLISIIAILTGLCLLCYQPFELIINNWLDQYKDSLIVFKVILPGIILSSCITIIMFNYYKALNYNFRFFLYSIFVLLFSIIANIIAYSLTNELISISIASIFTLTFWYVLTEITIVKKLKVKYLKNLIYIILVSLNFYLTVFLIDNLFISFVTYLILFLFISIIFHRKLIKNKLFI